MRQFIDERGEVFDKFLDALKGGGYSKKDLNVSAVYQFLTHGALYFEETFIQSIYKCFSHQSVTLDPEKGFIKESINSKNPLVKKTVNQDPVEEFINFFQGKAHHLKGRKISVDLTGGIDSRLVALCLKYVGIQFDAFYSMEVGNEEELRIVEKLSNKLDTDLKVLKKESIAKDSLRDAFEYCDGCWDILYSTGLVRSQMWRKQLGYDLIITGVAGEMYKDFWWLQDFPFYQSSEIKLEKLIKYRIRPVEIDVSWWGELINKPVLDKEFPDRLRKYLKPINTDSYDQIYYHVKIKEMVSVLSSTTNHFVSTYSPLLESELLSIGYNLRKKIRFFNNFHRAVITRLDPEIARLETTEGGISVSDEFVEKGKDLLKYVSDKLTKARKKMGKRPSLAKVRTHHKDEIGSLINVGIQCLKDEAIFSTHAPECYSEFPEQMHGRILTLSYLLNELN